MRSTASNMNNEWAVIRDYPGCVVCARYSMLRQPVKPNPPSRRGPATARGPVRPAQAPAHVAPDQGGGPGSGAPDREARRGPTGERAAPVGSQRRLLLAAARAHLLCSGFQALQPGPGQIAAHAAHPSRRGQPQTPQQGGLGVPATATREAPGGNQGIHPGVTRQPLHSRRKRPDPTVTGAVRAAASQSLALRHRIGPATPESSVLPPDGGGLLAR
ncbi:hypothetical protein NDU88_005351 [Pleurodeles waltl]|uniref:Uncharacterized protein n=1 Tax=Pleurodeles waltl TaxID=8319 RepID=A0AAV7TU16_PLEWA|nr:hypothetical protein NDU88_005351 [Pleurodeles waltl]